MATPVLHTTSRHRYDPGDFTISLYKVPHDMPQFDLHNRRYNTLRLPGYDYNSISQLCAITLVTDLRRPLFADVDLAKSVLRCLLSDQTLDYLRLCAFTLMPDHLHILAGVRDAKKKLQNVIGLFKSYTTQQYWKRSREILEA